MDRLFKIGGLHKRDYGEGQGNLMEYEVNAFITYLHNEKKISENTEVSYKRDLTKLSAYLDGQGVTEVGKITFTNLNSYVLYLEKNKLSPATI